LKDGRRWRWDSACQTALAVVGTTPGREIPGESEKNHLLPQSPYLTVKKDWSHGGKQLNGFSKVLGDLVPLACFVRRSFSPIQFCM